MCVQLQTVSPSVTTAAVRVPIMRARQRRPLSPDQYFYALQDSLARLPYRAYRLKTAFSKRGLPSLHVVVLIDAMIESDDAVEDLYRELEEFGNVQLFVTQHERHFMALCSCPMQLSSVAHDDDGDDDVSLCDDV